jgi:predicted kinase
MDNVENMLVNIHGYEHVNGNTYKHNSGMWAMVTKGGRIVYGLSRNGVTELCNTADAEDIAPRVGKLIVLSGLPGAGKTTYRKEYLSHLPCVDMSSLRDEYPECAIPSFVSTGQFYFSVAMTLCYAKLQAGADIIIEGIFAPDKPFTVWLMAWAKERNVKVEVITITCDPKVCKDRVTVRDALRPEKVKILIKLIDVYASEFK